MTHRKPDYPDFGTPELQARGVSFTGTKESEMVAHVNTQVPLDYYLARELITIVQFAAGEEYHKLWLYGAEKSKTPQMRFSKEQGGAIDFARSVELEERYNNAGKAINGIVTKLVVFNVCCMGEWAGYLEYVGKNRRMQILKDGLDDLDRHFNGRKKKR